MSTGRPIVSDNASDEDRSFDLERQSSSSIQEGSSVGDSQQSAIALSSGIESVSAPHRSPMGVGSRGLSRMDTALLSTVLRKAYLLQWVMFPRDLGLLLRQAAEVVRVDEGQRVRQEKTTMTALEEEQLTRLCKEAVPVCLEKCLGNSAVRNWSPDIQCDVFEACLALGELTVASAKRFTAMSQLPDPGDSGGWDYQMELEELLPLLIQLREAISWHSEFSETNRSKDVSKKLYQGLEGGWVHAHPLRHDSLRTAVLSTDAEEIAAIDAPELLGTRFRWQAHIVEEFMASDGLPVLQNLIRAGRPGHPQSLALIEAALGVIAAAMTYLVAGERRVIMRWLTTSLLEELDQQLQDSIRDSSDRISTNATSGLFGHLYAIFARAPAVDGVMPPAKDVAQVQRRYIEQLVKAKKGLFARQLAALREVDSMLHHIEGLSDAEHDQLLQDTVAWLRNSEVLAALLAENLHQRQYADLVARVLSRLAPSGGVSNGDLDLLWGIAQKEDTFEAVKDNVYNLLGTLAMALGPVQLDVLFSKFESCGAGGMSGDAHLTHLLNKLIDSDTQATPKLADRLPELLWHLVFPATAASGAVSSEQPASPVAAPLPSKAVVPTKGSTPAMQLLCAAVLKYDSALPGRQTDLCFAIRCVSAIAGDQGTGVQAEAALQLLQLLASEHISRSEKSLKKQQGFTWIDIAGHLVAKQNVMDVVLKALLRFQATETARLSSSERMLRPESPPVSTDDALASFHVAAIQEFARYIQAQTQWLQMQLTWEMVDQLWQALCAAPPYASDRAVGLRLLTCDVTKDELLTCEDAATLLTDRLPSIDPASATEGLVETHIALMFQVNKHSRKLKVQPDQQAAVTIDIDLTGMKYLWRLALEAPPHVHVLARNCLLNFHTVLAPPLEGAAAAEVHADFLRECARRVVAASRAATGNTVTAEEAESASQQCTSCLQLLTQFLISSQGFVQPSQPAHGASFVGDRMRINADFGDLPNGKLRLQLESHSNCYVGTLRKQLSAEVQARDITTPGKLRMFYSGKELRSDGMLLKDVQLVVTTDTLSMMAIQVAWAPAAVGNERTKDAPIPPGQLLASLEDVQGTLAVLAQDAFLADTRAAAVRLGELLPTRTAEIEAVSNALLSTANPAAAVAAALTPRTPSRVLYMLQVIASFEQPADTSVQPGRAEAAKATLRRPDVLHSIIDAVWEVQADTSSPTMLATMGNLALSLLDRQLADARQEADNVSTQQHSGGSESAASMSVDTASTIVATAETDFSPKSVTKTDVDRLRGQAQPPIHSQNPPVQPPQSVMDIARGAAGQKDPVTDVPAAGPSPAEDELDTVWLLAFRFVAVLASKAAAQWLTPVSPSAMRVMPTEGDFLAECALRNLGKWLLAWPALAPACLMQQDVGSSFVMCLLSPHATEPGRAAAELLTGSVVKIRGARAWLLNKLSSSQELAKSRPDHCDTFYSVACVVAEGLSLADPAQALAGSQVLGRLLAAVPTMERDSSPYDHRLQGQLRLLAALLVVLDGQGSMLPLPTAPAGSLTTQLITEMLFPESALTAESDNATTIEQPRCSFDASRQAALDLLQVVMSRDAEALQEGAALLLRCHMDCLRLIGWNRHLSAAATRGPSGYVGLRNLGATCYANSVFQQLFMQPSIRALLLSGPEDPPALDGGDATPTLYGQLQLIFAHLAAGKEDAYDPSTIFTTFRLDDLPVNVREHQDADEFFVRLQDVDTHLQKLAGRAALKSVLGGKVCNQVIAPSVPFVSEREEDYCRLEVDVVGKGTLQAALAAFVKGDLLDGGNQYYCDQINAKVDAVRRTCIKTLPQMLVMQLKRFDFDFETLLRLKRKDYFAFPVEIDMAPYTADGLAAAEAAAAAEKDGEVPPPSPPQQMYKLKGIIVHAGSAFAGHYYSYIQERDPGSKWHLYDDTSVESWNVDMLEDECFGGKFWSEQYQQNFDRQSSAYMLFYERVNSEGGDQAAVQQPADPQPGGADGVATDMDATTAGPTSGQGQAQAQAQESGPGGSPVGPPSSPKALSWPASAAATQPREANGARPMDTSMPEAELPVSSSSDGPEGSSSAGLPYSMPPGVWSHVAATNLRLQREQHCLSAPYFRFVAEIVKAWRTRGIGSGSSGSSKMRRVGDSGEVTPELPRPPAAERRPEDTASAVATAARLGISFFFNVFCRSSQQLKDESGLSSLTDWVVTLAALIRCDAAIALHFLSTCKTKRWLISHLEDTAPKPVRVAVVSLLDAAFDSVFISSPDRSPTSSQVADAVAVQLVEQLCNNTSHHLQVVSSPDSSTPPDGAACFDACMVICRHSHSACGFLLSGQADSCVIRNHLASVVGPKHDRFSTEHLRAGLHLVTTLLLSTEGPQPTIDTSQSNPYTSCPPESTPHRWPPEFDSQVTSIADCISIILNTLDEPPRLLPAHLATFSQSFIELMRMVSWKNERHSVPVLFKILTFLSNPTVDETMPLVQVSYAAPTSPGPRVAAAVHRGQFHVNTSSFLSASLLIMGPAILLTGFGLDAIVQMLDVQDSLTKQRLSFFFEQVDSGIGTRNNRSPCGLLLQTLRALDSPRPHHTLGIALLHLLHGIATCHPAVTFKQVQETIRELDSRITQALLSRVSDLQSNIVEAQARFNEPQIAADYPWTAEPGLAEMLEVCKELLGHDVWPLTDEELIPDPAAGPSNAPPP